MHIVIRKVSQYKDVILTAGNTSINMGLLTSQEAERFANELREAAYRLDGKMFVEVANGC